jgi:hypothetical protein
MGCEGLEKTVEIAVSGGGNAPIVLTFLRMILIVEP